MKNTCKFCLMDSTGAYCSNCGNKIINEFNKIDFLLVFNNISDRSISKNNNILSDDFKIILEENPFGMFPSKKRLTHLMLLTGYTIRFTEELFGHLEKIKDDNIEMILKEQNVTKNEKIRKITDYIDLRSNAISLDGVDKKYLIIKDIIETFNSMIEQRFWVFFKESKKEGFKMRNDFTKEDQEIAWEIAFRNAVWGYLYKMVESNWFK